MDASSNNVPRHVGIILDGNRRFAQKLMLKPWHGHEWGAKKVEKVLEWCKELNIKELTLYAFSIENFNRPKEEFDYLMKIFNKEFTTLIEDPRLHKEQIKIRFIGRIHMFPEEIRELMLKLMDITKNHDGYILNFAMAYGGRSEVVDATKKIAELVKNGEIDIDDINEETFSKQLYMSDDVDLVIRTGGEKRTSNFLPYQGAYAEWVYLEKMWPEFEKDDFMSCIEEFKKRKRRFGR